jgi:hypothetical protein
MRLNQPANFVIDTSNFKYLCGELRQTYEPLTHKVRPRSEEEISEIAARCWASWPPSGLCFDVFGFVNQILSLEGVEYVVPSQRHPKGRPAIKFFNRSFDQDDPAFVKFAKPGRSPYVTLNVDRNVWEAAKRRESFAIQVLAHEVGHILLHDHVAHAFSTDQHRQKLFEGTSLEDWAEWQAIIFAGHLLIPNWIARKLTSIDVLSAATNTTEGLARERLTAVSKLKRPLQTKTEFCIDCNDFIDFGYYHGNRCSKCRAREDFLQSLSKQREV